MSPSFTSFSDELQKIAGIGNFMKNLASEAGGHKTEIAGLGVLAAPSVDEVQAHTRAALAGDYNKAGVEKRTVLPHVAKPLTDVAGLGMLMGPPIANLMKHAAAPKNLIDFAKGEAARANKSTPLRLMGGINKSIRKNKDFIKGYGTLASVGAGFGALGAMAKKKPSEEGRATDVAKSALKVGIVLPATFGVTHSGLYMLSKMLPKVRHP